MAQNKRLAMKEQLKLLLKIQEFDSQLADIEMNRNFFPGLIKTLEEEIIKIETEYETKKKRLIEARKERDFVEIDIKKEEEELENSGGRLAKVTTNREYDAVQSEIDFHQTKRNELTQRKSVLADEIETLASEVEKLEKNSKNEIEKKKSQMESTKRNSEEIDQIVKKILEGRDVISSQISPQILSRYKQIQLGRGGVAVVRMVNRACGGCAISLPPQRIQEIRGGSELVICEICGRIIIDTES